jgi:sulfate transport system ATP-binding protein
VAILNKGRIEQIGTPAQVYDQPASPFVYGFVGETNRIPGQQQGDRIVAAGATLARPEGAATGDGPVTVFVRPQDLQLAQAGQDGWQATVLNLQRSGPRLRLHVRLADGTALELELPATAQVPQPGEAVALRAARYGAFSAD